MKYDIFKIIRQRPIIPLIILISGIIIIYLILSSGNPAANNKIEKPVPAVSIGCDRVLWQNEQDVLEATATNIDKPSFEWRSDGILIGTTQKLTQKFEIGVHSIRLNVSFNNLTLSKSKSISVIDSVKGVGINHFEASKNQRGFQTMFKGKNTGVKGVSIYVDSFEPVKVNECGFAASRMLFAGTYSWKARYRDTDIGSGTFEIKEASEMKISKVDMAQSYTAGSYVNAKIILINSGSVTIIGFDTKITAVNNDFAWMGDKAKREYNNQYTADIKPGDKYEIPIQLTIPEKVAGIRPAGRYSITIDVLLNGKKTDTRVVNTVIK